MEKEDKSVGFGRWLARVIIGVIIGYLLVQFVLPILFFIFLMAVGS